MNKKTVTGIFWGVLIIGIGVILGGNMLNLWNIDLLFPGWWTLFIILPCVYSMVADGVNWANAFGLLVGVLLLLDKTELLGEHISLKLIFPIGVVAAGVSIIYFTLKKNRTSHGGKVRFGEQKIDYSGKVFEGGDFRCTFGSMCIDLSSAVIKQEKPFTLDVSFGEVTVYLPAHVSLDVRANAGFGKVNTLYPLKASGIPLEIKADCAFGEITIK